MTDDEILGLLIYANELDGRHSPNEAKVYAWQEVLEQGAPGMTVQFAKDQIKKHYSLVDAMITPAVLVNAWKQARRIAAEARIAQEQHSPERHCGRTGCLCTHTEPCFKGWFDSEYETSPCPVCRSSLAHVLAKVGPPGGRTDSDLSIIRHRHLSEDV